MAKQAAKVPDSVTCPFTGKPVEIRHNEKARTLQGIGEFWMTALYDDDSIGRQQLMYDLSQRCGRPPRFPRRPVIEVRDNEPPEKDVEAEEAKERGAAVEEFLEKSGP